MTMSAFGEEEMLAEKGEDSQESRIIGTDIDNDRQDTRRIDTSAERVNVSFSDTDQDSSYTLISDTQNTFWIGDDNEIDLK